MADRALIQGAAAVAAGKAAKGMAFRESMATSAGNLALKMAEAVEKREQKIADGSALAKANFMTWDTNGLPPKYAELIQKEMAAANEKLNETGKDIKISGAAQKAIMDKIVRDAENKAKGYAQNIQLEREVGALNMQLEDPQIAQTVSGLVDPDIHDKITKVGGGKYTLDNNNNYIFEGDEKAYSFQEVQEMVQKFKNSTYDRTQVAGIRNSNLEIAAKSKNQKDYETNIDNLMKGAYSLTNPKDVFQMKAELVNVYEQQPEDVQDLSPQQLYNKLKEIRVAYGKDTVPEPVLTAAPGAEAFKAITAQTNRYINEGRLAGENSVLKLKKLNGNVIEQVNDLGNGVLEIKVKRRMDAEGIETTTMNYDLKNKDDRKEIDRVFANEVYSGKALQDYESFYLQNFDNVPVLELKKLESTNTNTTSKVTDYPDFIKNASDEPITASEAKKFIGRKGSQSIGNDIIMTIKNDYEGVYSEKNIREAAWDNDAKGTDAEGRAIGKTAFEAGNLESETKKEKINLLLESTNTTPATRLSKDERDDLSEKDRKDLKEFGIVTQIAGITKKDLAILDYMREAGFKTKLEYEQALAAQFE
jgi:hypothetical protein